MITIAEFKPLVMRLGGKPGHATLFVDLANLKNPIEIVDKLCDRGYALEFRFVQYANGLHPIAILKEQWIESEIQYDALSDEWLTLSEELTPDDPNQAFRLWRKSVPVAETIAA